LHARNTIKPAKKKAYAFGSGVKERTASFTQKYRFGFNNQEQETELGEYYSFEYADNCRVLKKPLQCRASTTFYPIVNWVNRRDRVHDARLGRFLSVDPLAQKFAFATPFNFAKNKPIQFIDFLGCAEADPAKPGAQGVVQSGWGLWTFCQQYGIKGSNFIEQADALIQANRVSFPGYPADGSLEEKQEFINSNKCSIYPNQALYLPKGTKVNTYIDAVPGVQDASIAGGYYKENGLNAQLGKAPIVYGKPLYIPNTPNNLTSLSNKSSEPLGEFGFTKPEPSNAAQSGGGSESSGWGLSLYSGVPIISSPWVEKGAAFTPGPFIVTSPGIDPNKNTSHRDLIRHEVGHVATFIAMGASFQKYLSTIAIPSAINYQTGWGGEHHSFYTEKIANTYSEWLYGPFNEPTLYPSYNPKKP